jgi:hypothetical protein
MQTDIKLVKFGKNLRLQVKKVRLEGEKLTPKQLQSLCNKLPIAATPYHEQNNQYILIECKVNLTRNEVKIDEWTIKLVPTNESFELSYQNKDDRNTISEIYKRSLLSEIEKTKKFWKLDSPRIFYENIPFYEDINFCIYRRFEVSEIDMDYKGLAFGVDISTAFFSKKPISNFSQDELNKLLRRQKEQKGTLLYKGYDRNSKCYFEKFDTQTTLGTASAVNVLGERFSSPFEYFKAKQPKFNVSEHDNSLFDDIFATT